MFFFSHLFIILSYYFLIRSSTFLKFYAFVFNVLMICNKTKMWNKQSFFRFFFVSVFFLYCMTLVGFDLLLSASAVLLSQRAGTF